LEQAEGEEIVGVSIPNSDRPSNNVNPALYDTVLFAQLIPEKEPNDKYSK
jgi:hypothetical protein